MKCTSSWWKACLAAGLGASLIGCGGSSKESDAELAPLAQTPAPAPAPAPAPPPAQAQQAQAAAAAAAPAVAAIEPEIGAPAAVPNLDPLAEGASGSEAPSAPVASSTLPKSPDVSATDDLLALARSAPPPATDLGAPPAEGDETATAAAAPPSATTPPYPGNRPGYPGAPPGYPGPNSGPNSAMMANRGGRAGPGPGYPGATPSGDADFAEAGPSNPYAGGGQAAVASRGMAPGGPGGPGGMAAMMAGNAGPTGRSTQEPDFSNPVKGAETFLAAVQAKDVQMMSDSVALRAPYEADPKTRPIFQKLIEGPQSVDQATVDLIYDALKDMKVSGTNTVKSTARLGVIVGRQEENGDQVTRTITMRREKEGWKVADVSGPRRFQQPGVARGRTGAPGAGGGSSGAEGSYRP